jgi:CHAT domain-containing protein
VGVGDAVYNRADPRALPAREAGRGGDANLELPRLPGSGREVESCARVWTAAGRKAQLLEGLEANKQKLMAATADRPAVLHVAGHMLFPAQESGSGMLALSIVDGEVELLSETEVAGMPAGVELVVLDGCSSGRGAVLPGAGLMGMTRAWLAAGARAVIAARWPVPDQGDGAIFAPLYRLYLERDPGAAPVSFGGLLRDAQLAELQAGGKRAAPANWASYFSVERN